ncbi:hypothetical protein BCR39DRAFT_511847 [Naematelia encephala]|uniref:Integral membrane bound transporter domain-containing protein n=1 Tax=Naematelia encephala TaxID=71784 RepID=A0A1Y2BLU8_9TREE|nr:hypothetical protein BCR39DRAFT_511847 [Naematelia encephala]
MQEDTSSRTSIVNSPLQPLDIPDAGPSSRPYTPNSATAQDPTLPPVSAVGETFTRPRASSSVPIRNTINTYRPRPSGGSTAWHRSGPGESDAKWGSGRSTFSTVRRTKDSSIALDNWETLQELVDDGSDDGQNAEDQQEQLRRRRSLRSIFMPSPAVLQGQSEPLEVPGVTDDYGAKVSGVLSSSPPQMEIGEQMQDGTNTFEALGNGDGPSSARPSASADQSQTPPLLRPARQSVDLPEPKKPTHKYWPPPVWAIAILKCSLAYLIASLFTFVPALARILSTSSETDAHGRITHKPAYSAHMVATIVVYFNPAKTMGNMILSTRFCLILAGLATIVSLLTMGTIELFDHFSPSQGSRWDWISEMGDWIVCIVWIGGSMGALAWSKVWVGNPSFNSGCSMAAVTLYTVIIKEGLLPKLLEVLVIVLIGATITNLVCFLVFPISATTRLQNSISKSLTSFSTLLDLLTSTFLLEKHVVREPRTSLKDAAQSHAAAFKTLKTDLAEAKHERILDGRIRGRRLELYDAAIGSLSRLAQHLASLRGSTRLQESLIRASREGKINLDRWHEKPQSPMISAIHLDEGPSADVDISTSIRLFLQFREIAGEQMDGLVSCCDDALDAVHTFAKRHESTGIDLAGIRNNLATSLREFVKSSSTAIKRVYAGPKRERGLYGDQDANSSDESFAALEEDEVEGPNETVFLIYFFLFTLEEFARELLFLLDTVHEIFTVERLSAWDHVKSLLPSNHGRRTAKGRSLYKQFRQIVPIDPSKLQPPLFPQNSKHARGTLLTPPRQALSALARVRQTFWEIGAFLRRPDMRYAIKTGLGGAILAAPAFTEVGRPVFLEYRGEWALIAYFATMSPTVGQTNYLSFFRVLGTILGAAVAVLAYSIFPDDPITLPIIGFLFSIPCFYVITQMPDLMQAGRFILLTYNLTCLYAYNQRDRDLTVASIAFHRAASVIIGVVWAAIVSRYWWPFTARRELRIGLSDFCLDLSYLYSKLVTTYSRGIDPPEPLPENQEEEQEPLLPPGSTRHPHLSQGVRQFMSMELHLQSQLGNLRELLAQTKNEPRLKGPFAFDFYKEVLLSCERMLDRLHSMRCVTTRDEWDNGIREAFVAPVNRQRREMAGNVILYFYTLSAGFRLRSPMPPYLPPAEHARQRLVEAIRNLDVVKRRSVRGGGRHLLFFAYALAMQEVIAELEYLGEMLQDAFGVISQSTVIDFEALFQASPSTTHLSATRRSRTEAGEEV